MDESTFPTGPDVATFNFATTPEVPAQTLNTVYLSSFYGFDSNPNAPTVSSGGFFEGQSLNTNGFSVDGNPSRLLVLDPGAPNTITTVNGGPLLGSQVNGGPIALMLSHPVAAIGVSVLRAMFTNV